MHKVWDRGDSKGGSVVQIDISQTNSKEKVLTDDEAMVLPER